jgi:leucyl/phenylalanyl-tRNA--protein transferase
VIFDLDGTLPDIGFPDARLAENEPNGLLAIGGDLSLERLLNAYAQGVFPWYSSGQPILWWSPAPRMVLYPNELHISRSLRRSLRRLGYELSVNQSFEDVIRACAAPRDDHPGTWLVPEMISAYIALHKAGHAHSIEVWLDDQLVGGLYGVALGQVFFGESMFSRQTDASKVALVALVHILKRHNYTVIDCQVGNPHLFSLGAREITRLDFEALLDQTRARAADPELWSLPGTCGELF